MAEDIILGKVRTRPDARNTSFLSAWRANHGPEALRLKPQAQAARAVSKRGYAGAQWGRTMADWVTLSTSADAELFLALRPLRNRSRDLVRNNEYAKNAIRQIVNNVVGGGVNFQATVPMRRGKGLDKVINDRIEAAWKKWCRKEYCHTAGRLSFSALERAVIRSVAINGEVLIRKVKKSFAGSPVPFALEVISPDQLVDQWSGYKPTENEVRMGVEVDEWQRPVAYWLYPRHPGDNQVGVAIPSSQYLRVPADEVIHIAVFEEAYQTRGIPWLHATLVKLRHMGGYEEAEIIAARGSAAIMGFIQTPEMDMPELDADADDVIDNEQVYDMSPGLIKKLGAGESFTGFNPSRPNAAMDPFMRYMARGVAAGVGMSYESLSGDYSQSTYSGNRMSLLPERDNWRVIQGWLIETFHQAVYEGWLDQAVMHGALNLPAYELTPDLYYQVRWQPRGWDWIDPVKEIAAARSAIRAGLATVTSVLASKGEDIEDVFNTRRRELDMAAELDLVLDTDPAQVNDKGAVQVTPAAAEQNTGADPEEGGATATSE